MAKKKSTKTTLSGYAAAIGVLLIAIGAMTDGDPKTQADFAGAMQAIGALMTALGIGANGHYSRDDDVTSEGRETPKN